MTQRVIETKLPEWIQVVLTAKKTENPSTCETFQFLLDFLRSKRKEARKLVALRDAEPPKHMEKKKGAVNVVVDKKSSEQWDCLVTGCTEKSRHFLSNCPFTFSVILFSGEVILLPLRLNFVF